MADTMKEPPKKAKRLSLGAAGAMVELPGSERPGWASPLEFILSCVGYAVGIGNIWRFPYLVYRNGGGAFLIPFTLMLITMGLPIFFLELTLGQYSRVGPTLAFTRMAPAFQGLGYCTIVVISFVTIYYMVITSWTLFYTVASFSKKLAWAYCDNAFNTKNCYSGLEDASTPCEKDMIFYNRSCREASKVCEDLKLTPHNLTRCLNQSDTMAAIELVRQSRVLSTEEYFNIHVLGASGASWDNFGGLRWELLACLTVSWILCYFCLYKGVQTVGKVVYFTALFPYFVLVVLMIRGATLEGSWYGMSWFISPQWEKLTDASVWADAASQVFYSLGIGCGSLVTLASYSSFTNNCHRDAIFVTITNLMTSVFAGFVTFSIMGFLATKMNLPIESVVRSEAGLAFVVFPEAVVRMPLPNLWAILFFFMLFILGISSQFAGVQAISSAILDIRPDWRRYEPRVVFVVCFLCWLLAIPMVFDGGVYLFTLMDWNTASWAILLIGFAELVLPSWIYGSDELVRNLGHMKIKFGGFLRLYWKTSWMFFAPATCLGVFAYQMYTYKSAQYGQYVFPAWADVIGVCIGLATLVPMPVFAFYRLWKGPRDRVGLLSSTPSWGPATAASSASAAIEQTAVKSSLKDAEKVGTCNPTFQSNGSF